MSRKHQQPLGRASSSQLRIQWKSAPKAQFAVREAP